jgi:hypothetical protein
MAASVVARARPAHWPPPPGGRKRRKKRNRTARAAVVHTTCGLQGKCAAVLMLLSVYVLIGILLAALWSGASAIRHVSGLKAFVLVVAAWPLIICGLIIAGRNF